MVINGKEVIFFHRPPHKIPKEEAREKQTLSTTYVKDGQTYLKTNDGGEVVILGKLDTESQRRKQKEHREKVQKEKPLTPINYKIYESGGRLWCDYELDYGWDRIKDRFEISTQTGAYVDVFYNANMQLTMQRDMMIINPYTAQMNLEIAEGFYFAKYVVTDKTILIYIRGRLNDMPGMRNVTMTMDQNSIRAFQKFSTVAGRIIQRQIAKRTFLGEVDSMDSLCYLEAQVDLLTQIILKKGLADGSTVKAILEQADRYAVYRYNNAEQLMKKMDEKRRFREKQVAYYKKIQKLL